MTMRRLFTLALLLGLLTAAAATAAAPHRITAAPLTGPCTPGAAYDPACDANQDGHITIADIQLAAGHWNQNGAYTSDNNHTHLGQTWTGSNNPLKIQGAFGASDYAGLVLSNSSSTGVGLRILSSGMEAIYVDSAGTTGLAVASAVDGVYVRLAGSPSSFTASPYSNGFEVAGAQGNGLHVGRADGAGVRVLSAGFDGVYIDSAGSDGVHVGAAGSPSSSAASPYSNGFEVAGAQGDGLYVGRADRNGVYVVSASQGVVVDSTVYDGMNIYSTGDDGVSVGFTGNNGVYVNQAGTTGVYANTAQANGQWGLYTPDAIHGSNVLMHSLSLVAQVSGPDGLTPGDIVAVAGVTDPVPGSTVHTPLVRLAGGTFTNVVGVVESHLALTQKPSGAQSAEGETRTEAPASELRSVEGPAQPGDYVALTVLGAAQVKVDSATPIEIGQRLTIGAHGRARPLGTIKLQLAGGAGTADLPEGAPVVGVALEAAKGGLVWVMINPQ
ncbi:hypothetical protein [Candidatus Amarolinea aalborgensis]|uniref:hypothetical protein n=1 Tax=Candidatus Amarolinea aalborgensis TaxID=2249329 RepID=UPI003BF9AEE6